MNVQVTRQGKPTRAVTLVWIRRMATGMLTVLGLAQAELSILLCDDEVIHALNRDWRKKDRPTDVLAFALREGEGGELAGNTLGDVVISLPTAERQAREHGHTLEHETLMLLAHGLLHLLGWDHRTDKEDRLMRKEVDRIVQSVTVSAAGAQSKRTAKTTRKKTEATAVVRTKRV